MKKLTLLAVAAALVMSQAPALAGTTGNVVVTWNVTPAATLTISTNYNSSGAFSGATPIGILTGTADAPTTGKCNSGTAPTEAAGTDAFGQITPDPTVYTDCLFEDAANLNVVTTSTNWNLGVYQSAGTLPTNYAFCMSPNGTFAFGTNPTGSLAVAQSGKTAATVPSVTSTTCASGELAAPTTSNTTNIASADPNATVSAGTNIGMDYELALPPNAPTLASGTITLTYTLVAN